MAKDLGMPFAQGMGSEPVQAGLLEEDMFGGRATILVDQKFEALEVLCGCEVKNKYKVGVPDERNKLSAGSDFLFMHEESDCCERICCSVNRELSLFLRQGSLPSGEVAQRQQPLLMKMHKPFHLQFCCCMRPSMDVTDANGTALGRVEDPFICCAIHQNVYRAGEKQPAFELGPKGCCNLAMCCPCCDDLVIPVFQQGKEVAQVTHVKMDCCECLGMTNRMKIDFGSVQDPKDRAMLFASMMLVELEYFEQQKNQNN